MPFDESTLSLSVVRRTLSAARGEIEHFCVGFTKMVDGKKVGAGSGTLATAHGLFGILTAHHVAANLFDREELPVGLVHSDRPSASFVERAQLRIIEIAGRPDDGYSPNHPDLAFVQILDPNLVSGLRAKKSFVSLAHPLAPEHDLAIGREMFPSPWLITGAPAEMENMHSSNTLLVTFLAAEVDVVNRTESGDLDLLQIRAHSGAHGFPSSYKGASGGGLWFSPLVVDPSDMKNFHAARPQLAGTLFYEEESPDGFVIITANGPRSLYQRALERLCIEANS